MKEFAPSFSRGGNMDLDLLAGDAIKELQKIGKAANHQAKEKKKGFEVGLKFFGINGAMLGHGDPVRVNPGERVLPQPRKALGHTRRAYEERRRLPRCHLGSRRRRWSRRRYHLRGAGAQRDQGDAGLFLTRHETPHRVDE